MSAIEVFRYPATGQEIRTVIRDGEPWFVAVDVCRVLGVNNVPDAVASLDDDEKGVVSTDTPGGPQRVRIASEAGLYSLILRSRKPQAKTFKRWITHEVLPTIRKTGRYDLNPRHKIPQSFADALQLAADQARAIEKQNKDIAELEPRAKQADHHRAADGLKAVGDFANDLKAWAKKAHGVKVLHKEVWDFLGEIGLLIRGNTIRNNQPTAFATERDFIRVKTTEYETDNHGLQSSDSPRLTPNGEGWVWDRAVRRIAEHGSLKKPKRARSADLEPTSRS